MLGNDIDFLMLNLHAIPWISSPSFILFIYLKPPLQYFSINGLPLFLFYFILNKGCQNPFSLLFFAICVNHCQITTILALDNATISVISEKPLDAITDILKFHAMRRLLWRQEAQDWLTARKVLFSPPCTKQQVRPSTNKASSIETSLERRC